MEQAQEWVPMLQELAITYGLKIMAAIVIFFAGKWVAKFLRRLIARGMERAKVDPTLSSFAENVAYTLLMIVVILAALNQLGFQTTSLIAILGAAGLAVGLALQGSLSNFAAGVLLLLFRPFKTGDFIDAGGTMGIVESIQIFTTHLRTPDNRAVIVPNAQITGGTITNFSAKDTRRMDLVVGVSYDDDLAKTKAVLQEIIEKEERLLKDPPPTVGVLELGDSSINFAVRPWVKTSDYWDVYFDLMQTIKERLDEEGITIPFPQRDVHLYSESPEKPVTP